MSTTYTATEVLEAFEAHQEKTGDGLDEVWYDGPSKYRFKTDASGVRILNDNPRSSWDYATEDVPFTIYGEPVEVKIVEETGGMDEGSQASVTFSIGSQFFRKDGYYASHYGHDWDGAFYEVRPRSVTVTQYERI